MWNDSKLVKEKVVQLLYQYLELTQLEFQSKVVRQRNGYPGIMIWNYSENSLNLETELHVFFFLKYAVIFE